MSSTLTTLCVIDVDGDGVGFAVHPVAGRLH